MIVNRLIVPEYNDINFVIDHTENGEKYQLPEGYRYYIIIAASSEPFTPICYAVSESEYMSFSPELSEGDYIFELGLITANGKKSVILPALDERLRPVNQLLVLRRLNDELMQ